MPGTEVSGAVSSNQALTIVAHAPATVECPGRRTDVAGSLREMRGARSNCRAWRRLEPQLASSDIGMQGIVCLVSLGHVHEPAERLRAEMAVDEPFHVPDRFQGALGYFGYQRF